MTIHLEIVYNLLTFLFLGPCSTWAILYIGVTSLEDVEQEMWWKDYLMWYFVVLLFVKSRLVHFYVKYWT